MTDLNPWQEHRLQECEQEQREIEFILRTAGAGTWKWDPHSDMVELSASLRRLLGFEGPGRAECLQHWLNRVHPADRARIAARLAAARAGSAAPLITQVRLLAHDGTPRWFALRADWHPRPGTARMMLGACVDIEAFKAAQEARAHSDAELRAERQIATDKERAQLTLAAIADGVIATDADGAITSMNPAAERLTGEYTALVKGSHVSTVLRFEEPEAAEALADAIQRCQRERRALSDLHATVHAPGGRRCAVESSVAPIALPDGNVAGAVLVLHDLTEPKRLLLRPGFEASHDALTGLVNRREFEARLQRAIEHACQPVGHPCALLYLDLDQFRIVNDTCGHAAGDQLLRQLAALYTSHVRERDTLARIGDDEFALIVEHCDVTEALAVADKLLEATRNFRFSCKDQVFRIGVSIGLAPVERSTPSVEDAMRRAGHACCIARDRGRNRVYLHAQGDLDFAQRRSDMHWLTRISHALQHNQLELYCQPIVALGDPAPQSHFEILLRLQDGSAGPISPGVFLPAAERYDLILKIDRWVLASTLGWLAAHPEQTAQLDMCSINLSRRSLGDQQFHRYASALLERSAIPAGKLCFEITETGAIADMQKTTTFIAALAERGCRFALDDFGTGMTSFSYLKQLPVDFIKIDGSLIQAMLSSEVDYEMVRFTNSISHKMGRKTIAEYVTDATIAEHLTRIGVDFAQGYWAGKPRPLEG